MKVSQLIPCVFCVSLYVCDIKSSTSKKLHMSDLSKLDALVHKTHNKGLHRMHTPFGVEKKKKALEAKFQNLKGAVLSG